MKYYINGWREGKNYFYRLLGAISDQEKYDLENGNVVKKGQNEFWIVKD